MIGRAQGRHCAVPPRHLALERPPRRPRGRGPLMGVVAVLVVASAGLAAAHLLEGASDPVTEAGAADTDDAPIDLCSQAALADRVGLVLVVGLPHVTAADDPLVDRLAQVGVGGVMLRDENIADEEQARQLVDGLRARLGPELLVAVDDEGGRVSSMGALGQHLSSARRLGRQGPDAAYEAGAELGELAASIGIDWIFAPVADLDDGPADAVIGDRSFGADPATVTQSVSAFARGVRDQGLAVTAKHFPGHGGVGDPHSGDTVDQSSIDELEHSDLVPFDALAAMGAEATMVGHVTYPQALGDLPASLEPGAYELLRHHGFEGVAITDSLGMGAIQVRYGFDAAPAMAIGAGADAVLVNQGDQVGGLHEGLVDAVTEGRLDEARLDEAITRVLALRGQSPDGLACPG